jgi:hypothetical protein
MSFPTFLTVLVVAIIIVLSPLSPLPVSASSDSDESDTNTEQRLQQKNLGSGESDNFNCDENMITSASGVDCIPSGPAAPTPPPPTGAFTISGQGGIVFTCGLGEPFTGTLLIDVERQEDGSVTGTATAITGIGINIMTVTDATTDGNTFSLSGVGGRCLQGAFTVNGDCGTDVMASYEEGEGTATFTGDVECTLL